MKYVKLQQTAMINGLPRSPAEGEVLVTNAQADHLVDMGQVKKDDVSDADGFLDPADRIDGDDKPEKPATKKEIAAALDKQGEEHDKALADLKAAHEAEIAQLKADHAKALEAAKTPAA